MASKAGMISTKRLKTWCDKLDDVAKLEFKHGCYHPRWLVDYFDHDDCFTFLED